MNFIHVMTNNVNVCSMFNIVLKRDWKYNKNRTYVRYLTRRYAVRYILIVEVIRLMNEEEKIQINSLEVKSIELFCKLNTLLDESGQEILFEYDCTIHKIYSLLGKIA